MERKYNAYATETGKKIFIGTFYSFTDARHYAKQYVNEQHKYNPEKRYILHYELLYTK